MENYSEKRHELEASIRRDRADLGDALEDLKVSTSHQIVAVRQQLDPRVQFRKHPILWMIGAIFMGLFFGWRRH